MLRINIFHNTEGDKAVHSTMEEKAAQAAEYVREIRSGNAEAFTELYHATEKYVYFCVVSQGVPEDAAADVMQEVYLAVYKDLHTLKEPQAALGWIKSVAFHKSMDYFRRLGREVPVEDAAEKLPEDAGEETLRLPEDILDKTESQKMLWELIEALPQEYRQVLICHYFLECSVAELAKELGIPEGTVKTRLYRARKELGKAIEAVEKKQGIRLHTVLIAPVLGMLFHERASASQVPATVSSVVTKALAETAGAAAGGAAKTAAGVIAKKWIAAAVAALFIGGGVGLLLWQPEKTPPAGVTEGENASAENAGDNSMGVTPEPTATAEPAASPTPEPTKPPMNREEMLAAYEKLYQEMVDTHTWPDGSDVGAEGDFGEAMQYAVQDFDGDGTEELLVSVKAGQNMAVYREDMYAYDSESGECVRVSTMYPSPWYYDNGLIFGAKSNAYRFVRSLFRRNAQTGQYEEIMSAREVLKQECEMEGWSFPDAADKDGNGSVMNCESGDGRTFYMDNDEWEAYRKEVTGTGKQIKIKWVAFSEGWSF